MHPKSIHANFYSKNKNSSKQNLIRKRIGNKIECNATSKLFAKEKTNKKILFIKMKQQYTEWKPTKYFANCHEIDLKTVTELSIGGLLNLLIQLKPSNYAFSFLLTYANLWKSLRMASKQAIFFPSSNCCVIFLFVSFFVWFSSCDNFFFVHQKYFFFRLFPTKIDILFVYVAI